MNYKWFYKIVMDKEFLSYFNEDREIFSCASLRIIPQFLPGSFKTNYMIHHASLEMHFPNIFNDFFSFSVPSFTENEP